MRCPECLSDRLACIEYDLGVCPQSGYHDAGERFRCLDCGAEGEPGELLPEPKQRLATAKPPQRETRTPEYAENGNGLYARTGKHRSFASLTMGRVLRLPARNREVGGILKWQHPQTPAPSAKS